jgi:hypothetical protein
MDRRVPLLEKLYKSHCELIEIYNKPPIDNNVVLEFCCLFMDFITALNPHDSSKRFEYVFKSTPNLENKNELNAHLLTACEYAQKLVDRINKDQSIDLSNEIMGIVFDYAIILEAVEKRYNIPFGQKRGRRNMQVDSYISYKIAGQIFWNREKIKGSYMLTGYSIFAIRQAIELAGKELIGLGGLMRSNGEVYYHGTQIPWGFIVAHKNKAYFKLPFNPSEIEAIFKWANHFVHTGTHTFCYITALALTTVEKLYKKEQYTDYLGGTHWRNVNEICDYSLLKRDFEDFLQQKIPNNQLIAKWTPDPTLAFVSG